MQTMAKKVTSDSLVNKNDPFDHSKGDAFIRGDESKPLIHTHTDLVETFTGVKEDCIFCKAEVEVLKLRLAAREEVMRLNTGG